MSVRLPPEIFEKIMKYTDLETIKRYCTDFREDVICSERNADFWKDIYRIHRSDIPLPDLDILSWRELCWADVYRFKYVIDEQDESNIDFYYQENANYDYVLSKDEIIKIYESFKEILEEIVAVFDIHFDQENNFLYLYVVPNQILPVEEQRPFDDDKFYRDIGRISNYPFREVLLTNDMIYDLAAREDFRGTIQDYIDNSTLLGPRWLINLYLT